MGVKDVVVKQISIFLENKFGRLAAVTKVLGDAGINIRALSIADTAEFGILRLIVDQPDRSYEILKKARFTVSETEVLAVEVRDVPGGLAAVLQVMAEAQINIEYMYGFLARASEDALIVFRVEQPLAAIRLLQERGIKLLEGDKVYKI